MTLLATLSILGLLFIHWLLLRALLRALRLHKQRADKAENLLIYWYAATLVAHKDTQFHGTCVTDEILRTQPWRLAQIGEAFNETRLYLFPPPPKPEPKHDRSEDFEG